MQNSSDSIFKVVPRELWEAATSGEFNGSPVDEQDGYIHFSSRAQVRETVAKHFHGQNDLLIVTVDSTRLGESLVWEASRGGDLFPHLYGPLPHSAVICVQDLPVGPDGHHTFPTDI